jgi:hypothetical protein
MRGERLYGVGSEEEADVWYVCTWFEFSIGYMTSMFNFSPLGPNSVSLFKKY